MGRESVQTAILTATGGGGYEDTLIPTSCIIVNIWPEVDLTNDAKLETWDNDSASSGDPIFSTITYDGTRKDLQGATGINKRVKNGFRAKVTCAGAFRLLVDYL